MLTEEKFRKLDPFEKFKSGNDAYNNRSDNQVKSQDTGLIETTARLLKLENMGRHKVKIPLKPEYKVTMKHADREELMNFPARGALIDP
jgi:hypothetical protein